MQPSPREALGRIGLVAWALVLLAVVAAVFEMALGHGHRHPPYSTTRGDELGCRVLYEALGSIEGVRVERETVPLSIRTNTEAATLVIVGAPSEWWRKPQPEVLNALRAAARAGSRIVLAFDAVAFQVSAPRAANGSGATPRAAHGSPPSASPAKPAPWLGATWGVRAYRYDPPPETEFGRQGHGALAFELLDTVWTQLHRNVGHVVIAQRPWEGGTLVLAGDCWFLTNEGLREPQCRLLAATALGDGSRYVFHESHLGTKPTWTLRRRLWSLRLQGLAGVMLVLGLLTVWRQATPLWPVERPDPAGSARAPLSTASTDWSDLLRRHLSARELLDAAILEWQRVARPPSAALEEARALAQRLPPLDAWREITKLEPRRRGPR